MKTIKIDNQQTLNLKDLREIYFTKTKLQLTDNAIQAINKSANYLKKAIKSNKIIYGVNTGFGKLGDVKISKNKLYQLQNNLILSHAVGIGPLLACDCVKLILALKINSLSRGFSGIRLEVINILLELFNKQMYPCVPSQGSVGACGDLAPLAHLTLALLGEGDIVHKTKKITANTALRQLKRKPIKLAPKEGLALINGTQVSTALALRGFFYLENIFKTTLISGMLSTIAVGSSPQAFAEKIHQVRKQTDQIYIGKLYQQLLTGCTYHKNHHTQSPYSIRCQPQVMGACYGQMQNVAKVLKNEANGVSDNPLIFADSEEIISCGNFHGQPIAFAADNLALAITEIGTMAERRIALLNDTNFSGLPAFLTKNYGINSGFMPAQVSAASLASENKLLAHPASVDSIPTSANHEDHVSMSTFAARRLQPMVENTAYIVAIELLAACQAVDLSKPTRLSGILQNAYKIIRKNAAFYKKDRSLAKEINTLKNLILAGEFNW